MILDNCINNYCRSANHPHHHGELQSANFTKTYHNPDCGDTITVFATIVDDEIVDISFTGNGVLSAKHLPVC